VRPRPGRGLEGRRQPTQEEPCPPARPGSFHSSRDAGSAAGRRGRDARPPPVTLLLGSPAATVQCCSAQVAQRCPARSRSRLTHLMEPGVGPGCDSNPNRQIRRLVLCVDLVGSSRIWPAHVGCLVDPVGSRRIPSDRLDDQTDDQASQATQSADSGGAPDSVSGVSSTRGFWQLRCGILT
jgi:hypothetical protein